MLFPISFSLLLLLSTAHSTTTTTETNNDYLKLPLIHIKHSSSPSHTLLLDSLRLTSLHRRRHNHRPAVTAPLTSGASSGSGQYFSSVSLGTPPQTLLLVADTGSDLTWVKCSPCRNCSLSLHPPASSFLPLHSSSFTPTHCFHPLCKSVPHPSHPRRKCRRGPHSPCLFRYQYSDGSLTSGIFSRETASFRHGAVRVGGVSFGCAFRETTSFQGATGVMGLGRGPISFSAQMGRRFGNRFSYCLADYTLFPPRTSYLIFGRNDAVFGNHNTTKVRSTPLIRSLLSPTFYYVGVKFVTVDGTKLPISPSVWALDELGNGGTVIDSGTTLSFLPPPAYKEVLRAVRERVRLPRVVGDTGTRGFELCYNVSGPGRARFPRLGIGLEGGSVLDPPPRNYFIDVAEGVKCLALQPVGPDTSGFAVIGNLMQHGFLFEFDNDGSRLLFSRNGCGR